jgi:2-oxoglutarate dehydrogenase E2 component (dihydrolipoamide succinyltransferase)
MSNTTQIIVPSAGESVTEVEISDWLKKEGDTVALDETVLVLETDKATLDLPAPVAGKLVKILKQKGDRVAVGDAVAEIETDGGGASTQKEEPKPAAEKAPANEAKPEEKPAPETKPEQTPPAETADAKDSGESKDGEESKDRSDTDEKAPPALVAATSTDEPTPEKQPAEQEHEEVTETSKPEKTAVDSDEAHSKSAHNADRAEEVVPMTLLRRKIAARLVAAQHTAALLTTFNEVDMSALTALRKENQERFQERHKTKLGFMSFFIRAVVEALREVPQLNAEIRGDDIVYRHYHDIAVAIGGGRGLVVPVLRDAGRMSFAEIELAVADFARRVKENKITPDELAGGTFTITNGGVYGSLLSTPLVNPPQSGILGMHAIQDRPVAIEGQVVIRPMMYVALGYDHRLVDGREAVQFLKRVKDLLESPARMLLGI